MTSKNMGSTTIKDMIDNEGQWPEGSAEDALSLYRGGKNTEMSYSDFISNADRSLWEGAQSAYRSLSQKSQMQTKRKDLFILPWYNDNGRILNLALVDYAGIVGNLDTGLSSGNVKVRELSISFKRRKVKTYIVERKGEVMWLSDLGINPEGRKKQRIKEKREDFEFDRDRRREKARRFEEVQNTGLKQRQLTRSNHEMVYELLTVNRIPKGMNKAVKERFNEIRDKVMSAPNTLIAFKSLTPRELAIVKRVVI
jgi:hypothetical protein